MIWWPGQIDALPGPNVVDEQVGGPKRDIEQRALPRRLIVRDRRFVEVPEVVKLVTVVLLELPALRARPRCGCCRIDRARRVEVAVLLLCRGDRLDQPIEIA